MSSLIEPLMNYLNLIASPNSPSKISPSLSPEEAEAEESKKASDSFEEEELSDRRSSFLRSISQAMDRIFLKKEARQEETEGFGTEQTILDKDQNEETDHEVRRNTRSESTHSRDSGDDNFEGGQDSPRSHREDQTATNKLTF